MNKQLTSRGESEGAVASAEKNYWLDRLTSKPYEFDFFTALRRLEYIYRHKPLLGTAVSLADEPLRLRQAPSEAFVASSLQDFSYLGEIAYLTTNFFGVFGPHGALPLYMTEYVRERMRNSQDRALVRFIDIFHHRILLFFYRAFANAHPTYQLDRQENDKFTFYLGTLTGMAPDRQKKLNPPYSLNSFSKTILYYSGLWSLPVKNAESLEGILQDFFGFKVKIQQFVCEWVKMPEKFCSVLGEKFLYSKTSFKTEPSLAEKSLFLGTSSKQNQGKFRLVIGPLGYQQYQAMLPRGKTFKRLVALVKHYLGETYHFDMQLLLDKSCFKPWTLGKNGHLALDSWLLVNKAHQEQTLLLTGVERWWKLAE